MAENQTGNSQNPNPQDGNQDGGKKLIAGKFKTVEEAIENGYGGLEKGFHETRQEVGALKETLERLEGKIDSYSSTSRESFGRREDAQDPSTQFLTRFYQDPVGTLEGYYQHRTQQEQVARSKAEDIEARNRAALVQWSEANPDVAPYGDLLAFYVSQTDARLKPETRLDMAAKKVRSRVLELKGASKAGGPNPGDHVEGPSDGGIPSGAASHTPAPKTNASPLSTYLAERSQYRKPQKPGQRQ